MLVEKAHIQHGGFLRTFEGVEATAASLVLTDLPYGVTKRPFDVKLSTAELETFCREARRVLKPEGAIFAFMNSNQINCFSDVAAETGFPIVRAGVWIKKDSHRRASPYPQGAIEHWVFASAYGDSRNTILPFYLSGHAPFYKKFEKFSPFRKPVSLMRTLIRNHSIENGLVIDPFAGSGSTGIAALLEGQSVVLGDIDAAQVDVIKTNIEHFEKWASSKPLKGFLRGENYAPMVKATRSKTPKPRKRRNPKRARWSHTDREQIIRLLYQHSFEKPITGAEYFKKVAEFASFKLTITHLRSISYRLIKELGPIPEGEIRVPSFAFDAQKFVNSTKDKKDTSS